MFTLTFFLLVFLPPLILGHQNVKFTALVYRHGDRTPVNCYPNDPYRNQSYWPVRFGQLTNVGKRQHFEYGRWLRDRYSHLLSEKYDPTEVHIQSTDVDRTLMSAQANLAGMYPPAGNEIWNNHLMWQPIPIHTRPEHDDEMLAMKKRCEKYEIEKHKYITSEAYLGELKKYKTLMTYLTKNTGMKVKHFEDIEDIYSCLTIENLYNFTLPSWTATVFPDKLRVPAGHSFAISAATPTMARLLIGPLVKHIINTMENVVNGNSTLKMSVYSGHDFTVGTLLTALGVFDGVCPTYTSTVFLELIEDKLEGHGYGNDNKDSNYYVRLLYRNTVEIVEPKVLSIPNCGTLCPLPKFIELYSHLITVNWEKECQVKYYYLTAVYIFLFALGASCLTWKMLYIQYPAVLRPATERRLLQIKTAAEVENLNP